MGTRRRAAARVAGEPELLAGFTHVALAQAGADTQEQFMTWVATEVLPALRER